jgi:hypothetical protein
MQGFREPRTHIQQHDDQSAVLNNGAAGTHGGQLYV